MQRDFGHDALQSKMQSGPQLSQIHRYLNTQIHKILKHKHNGFVRGEKYFIQEKEKSKKNKNIKPKVGLGLKHIPQSIEKNHEKRKNV